MTSGVLIQVLFDLILMAAVAFLWVKLNRPQKDDPRLSRGLQLLQSKTAVLEDLSDQVESQVQQITALIESKGRELQQHITSADRQIEKIEASMNKSKEVAKIFQDRIPHQEIVERQNTIKYVKAARLAHQGKSVDEIAQKVDLTRGEIELIAKVNREQLQFSESDLPEWAKQEPTKDSPIRSEILESRPLARPEDRIEVSLSALGQKFRQALPSQTFSAPQAGAPVIEMPASKIPAAAEPAPERAPEAITAKTTAGRTVEVQKVIFPRIDMTQHLS